MPGRITHRTNRGGASGPDFGWTPPYSLPAVGQAVAIGTNDAMDVAPTAEGWTTGAWDYGCFGSYGGGTLLPQWSDGGAYVIAGSGGHNHPDNTGALLFDFATATWSRRDNANGAPRKPTTPHSYSDGELSGAPWWEITGYTEVPAPAHPYAQLVPAALGAQGSVLYIGRSAVGTGANASPRVHRFDMATRLWSRQSAGAFTTMSNGEVDALWDATRNRYWLIPNNPHSYQIVEYLDAADWQIKSIGGFGFPPGAIAGAFRCFLHGGLIVRQCGASGLYAIDPDVPAAGWIALTSSGTQPSPANRFARFGSGGYYWLPTGGGNTLTRLVAPANPKTGTWVFSTVAVTGATLPAYTPASGGGVDHYTGLFYVPSINCLAWVPGSDKSVFLVRPE
jgi:hypothetical protein